MNEYFTRAYSAYSHTHTPHTTPAALRTLGSSRLTATLYKMAFGCQIAAVLPFCMCDLTRQGKRPKSG